MPTNFEYIEEVMDRALEAEKVSPRLTDKDRADANKQGQTFVAGFALLDEKAEKVALDAIVAKRRANVENFFKDRQTLTTQLEKLGIKALAIVPTQTWAKICRDAGLFVLQPDQCNQVGYHMADLSTAYRGWKDHHINDYAKRNWKDFLNKAWPTGIAPPVNGYARATVRLPIPPKDVQETLLKAKTLTLKVAAVAEAISFAGMTPAEIVKQASVNPKDAWAQAQGYADYADWVKRDPIIYTELGTAAAIIAQFGEFPIEKEVVDKVIATSHVIGSNVEVATMLRPDPIIQAHLAQQQMQAMQAMRGIDGQMYAVSANGLFGSGYTVSASGGPVTNSANWTGRGY